MHQAYTWKMTPQQRSTGSYLPSGPLPATRLASHTWLENVNSTQLHNKNIIFEQAMASLMPGIHPTLINRYTDVGKAALLLPLSGYSLSTLFSLPSHDYTQQELPLPTRTAQSKLIVPSTPSLTTPVSQQPHLHLLIVTLPPYHSYHNSTCY